MAIIGYFTLKRVSLSRAREDDLVRAHILGLRLGLRGIALARVEMPRSDQVEGDPNLYRPRACGDAKKFCQSLL